MRLAQGREAEAARLAEEAITTKFYPPYLAIAIEDKDGKLAGAVVLNGYTGADVELTLAGRGVWSRSVMAELARHVFGKMGCKRASITIRSSDANSFSAARKAGFYPEGVKRKGFGDEDAIIMGMLREECRWGNV